MMTTGKRTQIGTSHTQRDRNCFTFTLNVFMFTGRKGKREKIMGPDSNLITHIRIVSLRKLQESDVVLQVICK